MFGRYAKPVILVVALVVLAVEGLLIYKHYDQYYGRGTASVPTASNATASAEAAGSRADTGPETTVSSGFETSFVHRAEDQNSRGDYTYLSDPGIDEDPNAVVIVAPSPGVDDDKASAYQHNIGVWYEFANEQKWAIFNQDRAAVPAGSGFEVTIPRESEGFVHRASLANIVGNTTYLDDPLTNNDPGAKVFVTQNWNPDGGGGVYNDHPVGARYDEDVDRWFVYNEDGAPMPEGTAFNIAVPGGTKSEG